MFCYVSSLFLNICSFCFILFKWRFTLCVYRYGIQCSVIDLCPLASQIKLWISLCLKKKCSLILSYWMCKHLSVFTIVIKCSFSICTNYASDLIIFYSGIHVSCRHYVIIFVHFIHIFCSVSVHSSLNSYLPSVGACTHKSVEYPLCLFSVNHIMLSFQNL